MKRERASSNRVEDDALRGQDGLPGPVEEAGTAAGESFWETIGKISPAQWGEIVRCYLYRLEPACDFGTPHYCAMISEPFDETYILHKQGSGKYQARVKNRKTAKEIASLVFAVFDPDFPPRVRVTDLKAIPENDKYIDWLREAETRKQPAAAAAAQHSTTEQAVNPSSPADNANTEAVRQLADVARRILEDNARGKQAGGTGLDASLLDLFTRMAQARDQLAERLATQKPEPPPIDPLAMLDRAATVIAKLKPEAPLTPNPLGSVTELANTFKTLKEAFGNDRDAERETAVEPRSAWESIGGLVVDLLKPAMGPLGAGLSSLMLSRATGVPTQPAHSQTPPAAPPPTVVTVPSPTHDFPAENGHNGAAAAGVDQAFAMQMMAVAQMAASALTLGLPGDEFAEKLEQQFGQTTYDQIVQVPQAELIAKLRQVPAAWQMLQPFEGHIDQFVNEFYAYGNPDAAAGAPDAEASDDDESALQKAS